MRRCLPTLESTARVRIDTRGPEVMRILLRMGAADPAGRRQAERMLRELGYADEAAFTEVGERVKKAVEAGLEFAEGSPLPEGPETLEGVFATPDEVQS